MITVLGEELPSRCGDGNRVFEMRGVVGGVGGVLGLNVMRKLLGIFKLLGGLKFCVNCRPSFIDWQLGFTLDTFNLKKQGLGCENTLIW